MLCMALFTILTGCVGFVGPGGGDVYVAPPAPEVTVFGGVYEHPTDVHVYSHRGYESRAVAHPHPDDYRH